MFASSGDAGSDNPGYSAAGCTQAIIKDGHDYKRQHAVGSESDNIRPML